MRMRLIGVVALAALLLASQAMAADSYKDRSTAPFNWNGFYAGLNIGYGLSSNSVNLDPVSANSKPVFAAGGVATPLDVDTSGVVGGGQIGYNFQYGCWLLGTEADFQGAGMSDTTVGVASAPGFLSELSTARQELDWFGTVRGRVGWLPMSRMLIYVTGGLAYGRVENSASIAFPADGELYAGSSSDTRAGWTVGGGAEYAMSRCWTVKVEYLYMDLGSNTFPITTVTGSPGAVVTSTFDDSSHIVRVGVNYKF